MKAQLKTIALPEFGVPSNIPQMSDALYEARLANLKRIAWERGYEAVVVYADREHCSNLAYLTGFDPRFEESLFVITKNARPTFLTGPENQGAARLAQVEADVSLYPPFGLLGQDRTKTPSLKSVLEDAGIRQGQSIAAIGWKYFGPSETGEPTRWVDLPSYLADSLREFGELTNATDIMMHPTTGLRSSIEIDELARFEFAASHGSEAIKRVLFGVRPGMREYEVASLMRPIGLPLGTHPMLSSGQRASNGLNSPSDKVVELGDPFTTAFSYWGSLTSRAGFVASGPQDLPEGAKDYAERLAGPYFEAAAEWYETVGLGVSGGKIDAMVKARMGGPFFNLALNPGHLIHLDEWMNTPIYAGSTEELKTNSALQLDIIPATGTAYFTSNIEDGIAILDERGRKEFAERFPDAWSRIQARRAFMRDQLGINLKPETLPFSNLAGYLSPYILTPDLVFSMV